MTETKQKGLTTELQCQLYFTQLGYNVSMPLGEDCRYDMIVDFNGILCRIQVKTCHVNNLKTGIEFSTRSTQCNTQTTKTILYTADVIDYFATFYDNKCYLVPVQEVSGTQKTLLFENKRKNQQPITFIEDYEAEKQIQRIINGDEEVVIENTKPKQVAAPKNKIYQYDLEGNFIKSYDSCREAARELGDVSKNGAISQASRGVRKSAYGYKWKSVMVKSFDK